MGRAPTVEVQGLERPEAPLEHADAPRSRSANRPPSLPAPAEWPWWLAIVGYFAAHLVDFGIGNARDALGLYFRFSAGAAELDACFIATILVLSWIHRRLPMLSELGFRATRPRPALGWVVLFLIASAIFRSIVVQNAHPVAGLDPFAHEPRDAIGGGFVILVATIIVPIAEEVFYRGFVYGTLRNRFDVIPAAIAGGVDFGAAHWIYAGYPAWQALSIGFDGFLFCLLYEKTGSLWPGILIHAMKDGLPAELHVTGSATVGLLAVAAVVLWALIEPGGDRGVPHDGSARDEVVPRSNRPGVVGAQRSHPSV
jgi:uncharacterized protein